MQDLSDTTPTSSRADQAPIGGVCPVLATPFDGTGPADAHALTQIVQFAIRSGADAIVYPGVASEVEQLTDSERDDLLDTVARAVRGRVPLVVGASAADLETTILHLYKA